MSTFLVAGCALTSPSISDKAHVARVSSGCQLTISGQFPDMAHDPITLLFSGSSQIVARIEVPSLVGSIDAKQVHVTYQGESGKAWDVGNLVGSITFEASTAIIALKQRYPGEPERTFRFNGTFTLMEPQACA